MCVNGNSQDVDTPCCNVYHARKLMPWGTYDGSLCGAVRHSQMMQRDGMSA